MEYTENQFNTTACIYIHRYTAEPKTMNQPSRSFHVSYIKIHSQGSENHQPLGALKTAAQDPVQNNLYPHAVRLKLWLRPLTY